MAKSQASIVTKLQADFPAQDGWPSASQFLYAVEQAAAALSQAAGNVKSATLAVVSGTAEYTLPDDFIDLISIEGPYYGTAFVEPGGLLMATNAATVTERVYTTNLTLTIVPTPTYTMERLYRYKAGHVVNDDDDYPDVGNEEEGLILLKARILLLQLKQAESQGSSIRYSIGDVTLDKAGQAASLTVAIKATETEYQRRLAVYRGSFGVSATYSTLETSSP